MPHPCVVCGRSRMNPNNHEESYMFFGFPVNNDDRCKKWLEFCGREDLYKLSKKQLLQRMICSKHFIDEDFINEYYDRLNCTAVPTIYDPKQSLYNITCVLCGRFRQDPPNADYDGTTFHHFPGEEFRCLKWLDFVGVDSYYRLTRKEILFCYICSHHFDKSQFMPGYRNRLVDNSVPNIRHPDQMDGSEQFIMEIMPDSKQLHEKSKKLEPLPTEVLESQACAACGRSRSDPRNKSEKYKFHPFPAYEIGRCLRWCQFLGREDLLKMSPNQIRKLVLCNRHFISGQSFQKLGSCDAVPTILDVSEPVSIIISEPPAEIREVRNKPVKVEITAETEQNTTRKKTRRDGSIPFVSSKKPFIEDKPCPLAKKRGKAKRSTTIKIPNPFENKFPMDDIDNRVLRKLPLPPASRNCDVWKVQLPNNITPLTLANNTVTPIGNVNAADVKKVIVPFTGDISSLGKPIPVSSLSSIPPGLLIKINYPEVTKEATTTIITKTRKQKPRKLNDKSTPETGRKYKPRQTKNNNSIKMEKLEEIEFEDNPVDTDMAELLTFSTDKISIVTAPEEVSHEEVVTETLGDVVIQRIGNVDNFGESLNEQIQEINVDFDVKNDYGDTIDIKDGIICTQTSVNNEQCRLVRNKVKRKRRKLSDSAKRALIPIRNELSRCLKTLRPHTKRLPKYARAYMQLMVVNMAQRHL